MKEKPVTLRLAFAKRPHLEGHVRVTVVAECVAEKACVLGGTSWAHVGPFWARAKQETGQPSAPANDFA